MLVIPQKGLVRVEHNTGSVGTASIGTSVTTSGTSSVKGTPAEMIASTAFDAFWITIIASNYGASTVASQGSMDILIGAATEEVLIADLLMGYCGGGGTSGSPKRWDFPLYIPAGSRLACQAAGARTSTAFGVAVYLYGGQTPPFRVGGKVTTYGMGTVPSGTSLTPGASGAEAASFTQITASTTQDHFALVPSFQISGDGTTAIRNITIDMGYGAATEEVAGEGYWFCTAADESMGGPFPSMPWFQDIPSGTRLSMRASNHGTNDGAYNGVIHAVS